MTSQANKVADICFGMLRSLRKTLRWLPMDCSRTVVQGLILSHLDYGNSLYLGRPAYVIGKLQVIQNAIAQALLAFPKMNSARPALQQLHWLPIKKRIEFKALYIAHKLKYSARTHALQHLITPYKAPRALSSNNLSLCQCPKSRGREEEGTHLDISLPNYGISFPNNLVPTTTC